MDIIDEDIVDVVLEYCRFAVRRDLLDAGTGSAGNTHYTVGKYPLVKTFSSDVFPHAPSPLHNVSPALQFRKRNATRYLIV